MTEQEARAEARAILDPLAKRHKAKTSVGYIEESYVEYWPAVKVVAGLLASRVVAAPSDDSEETDLPNGHAPVERLTPFVARRVRTSQPVQVEVTDERVERAAKAAWEATMPGGFVAEPWDEADEADREDARAQMRAALAALGGGE